MATRVKIRMWRMVRPEAGPGMFVWFDPEREELQLYELKEPLPVGGVGDPCEEDDSDSPGDPIQVKTTQLPLGLPF